MSTIRAVKFAPNKLNILDQSWSEMDHVRGIIRLKTMKAGFRESAETSTVWPTRWSEILALLEELSVDCAEDNWDGEGSLKIDPISSGRCEWFLFNLPDEVPLPNVWCEPIGRVNACWENGKANINVSICGDLELLIVGIDKHGHHLVKRTRDFKVAVALIEKILES